MQPRSAPVPIFATFQFPGRILTVEFNKALQTSTTRRVQWRVWTGGNRHFDPAGTGTVFGRFVTVTLGLVAIDFQADHMAFTNVFDDVIGQNGLSVESFDPFPITII